jgi:hypothetical protein
MAFSGELVMSNEDLGYSVSPDGIYPSWNVQARSRVSPVLNECRNAHLRSWLTGEPLSAIPAIVIGVSFDRVCVWYYQESLTPIPLCGTYRIQTGESYE